MATTSIQTKLLAIQKNMLNFAYSLTSNRDEAYDLLQDTTLKVLDNSDKYTESDNFKSWVFTIMRNLFINNYRKAMRHGVVSDYSEESYLINATTEFSQDTPEDTMGVNEIMAILKTFPDEYRVPFSMHISGFKYVEIAQEMNLPVGTVKSRIFFARKRLQARLTDYR
ncbi:MAG: RNA polymerase sigma factor [Muribaculaceae bacterium]|nr:RNA polymerase sigma factor [Muribaculaceae bacterium]